MESIKTFWKTRAYSRIFIDNIGNLGFIPEIIYYKKKLSKKGKERILFLYYSTSKTYTNRSFLEYRPGTVNASDPIISTGLSESILKKQTDKQMLLFKGRAIAANKNCKKILMVSNVCISLCLACKIPRGILRGCPRKNGEHNFSTFTDFLIIVQLWFLWFYPRALRGLSMTQCTTRSSSQLNIPLFKTKAGQRSFYYRTARKKKFK